MFNTERNLAVSALFLVLLFVTTASGQTQLSPLGTPGKIDLPELLRNAVDGDEIYVPFGTYIYPVGLVIPCDNITIICEPGTQILVSNVNENVINIHGVNSFQIENAHLSHVVPLENYICHGHVIDIRDAQDITIINCDINGCGAIGVSARNADNLTIKNCWIHENTFNAIFLRNCDGVYIHSSIIENNANFFQMYNTTTFRTSNNLVRNNGGYWEELDPNPGTDSYNTNSASFDSGLQ